MAAPIKVFLFVAQMNGDRWKAILSEMTDAIQKSGLYDAAESISVCKAGKAKPRYPGDKYRNRYFSKIHQYEFPALHMVRDLSKPGDRVLYLHLKGVSRTHGQFMTGKDEWRRYLTWGCVEHWRECVAALDDGANVAGVQWTRLDPADAKRCQTDYVFAGNFWWATGDYISKLSPPHTDPNRWLAESWIVRGCPTVCDLHNLTGGEAVRNGKNVTGPNVPGFSRVRYEHDTLQPTIYHVGKDDPAATLENEFAAMWPVTSRTEILNRLAEKHGYTRYLEIGTRDGKNLAAVQCPYKTGVDPFPKAVGVTHRMESDAFFDLLTPSEVFDLVFVDGMHTEEQVWRDVHNALRHLAKDGSIVCHDCQPETEHEQRTWEERRQEPPGAPGVWLGTTWRAWARLRMTRSDLRMYVVDTDFGVGVIQSGQQETFPETDLTWQNYVRHRREWLNVISPRQFVDQEVPL